LASNAIHILIFIAGLAFGFAISALTLIHNNSKVKTNSTSKDKIEIPLVDNEELDKKETVCHIHSETIEKRELKFIETFYSIGSSLAKAGDYQSAIEEFAKEIEKCPNYDAYNERGIVFSKMEKYQEATADFTNAIAIDPLRSHAYNNRGIVFVKKKKYDLAIRDFSRAIQINPNDPALYSNRGGAYHEKGIYDLATNDYSTAMKLDPEYA